MKEFWVYNLARIALLAVTWLVVTAAWVLISGEVSPVATLLVAFVLSGIGSYFVLRAPREALARKIELRASRAVERFEESRAKEDVD